MNEAITRRSQVELALMPWYRVPLVRTSCLVCHSSSPWCGEEDQLVFWTIWHQAECVGFKNRFTADILTRPQA